MEQIVIITVFVLWFISGVTAYGLMNAYQWAEHDEPETDLWIMLFGPYTLIGIIMFLECNCDETFQYGITFKGLW